MLAQNTALTGGEFLLATVVETPASPNNFDYGPQGDHTMIPIPRPRVLSAYNTGTCLQMLVGFDSIAGGLFGPNAETAVTGFRLLMAASNVDPGRDPSAYALIATADSPGGAATATTVCFDCRFTDKWLVTQLSFEGGSVLSDAVGAGTRIHCQILADPKPKIGPKKSGPLGSSPD